ncbi:MAG: cytochrome c oxidase subunit II [Solirubrobacterales bacterium]
MEALIDTRKEFQDLWGVYLPIGVAVAVIVFGLVLFTLVRYRRRGDELPRGREGPPILEGLYALVLAGVVVFLLTMTFRTDDEVTAVSTDPGAEVDVTAFQWGWRFTYPGEGVTVVGDDRRPPMLVVPTDTAVRFTVTSRDVIHSFWIPELRFKRDAFPNREDSFDLSFEEDEMVGRCAEFCGLAHGEMTFDVVAMAEAEFDDWLATQRRAGEIQHGAPQ